MADDKTVRGKFGSLAYGTGFGFVVGGIALYQGVLRHHIPPLHIDGGWYDWNRGLGAGVFGALSGLLGGALGYLIERRRRG